MAYFRGNGFLLKGKKNSSIGFLAEGNKFEKNYGTNVGSGAALEIDGNQDQAVAISNFTNIADVKLKYGPDLKYEVTTHLNEIKLKNNNFSQNYAGFEASALSLKNLPATQVSLTDMTFSNNSGAYSFLEKEHDLPFYGALTMRRYSLNFF